MEDDNSVDLPRLDGSICSLDVFDRHLSLTVWAQPPTITVSPRFYLSRRAATCTLCVCSCLHLLSWTASSASGPSGLLQNGHGGSSSAECGWSTPSISVSVLDSVAGIRVHRVSGRDHPLCAWLLRDKEWTPRVVPPLLLQLLTAVLIRAANVKRQVGGGKSNFAEAMTMPAKQRRQAGQRQ